MIAPSRHLRSELGRRTTGTRTAQRVASPARLHEEKTRYAATLKAREWPIKKHGPSKEEIDLYPTTGSYSTQYGTSSSRPSSARATSSESACSAASKYKIWSASRSKKNVTSTSSVVRAGINGESPFEAALLERAQGCEVWGYDFTWTACPIWSVVLENGLSGLCVTRGAIVRRDEGIGEASPPFSFMRASRTESNSVYVNYNAGGKPRLAEYSFLNVRGDHSLVYEAADGADAY
ncbi:hypothetical protein EDB92DRAFT_2037898 [Lactarius akahatsu]|uniref:Uncharacterized protein n=1 Tax=Lactarius akahatsu TaxID=416441 RepID=A0AAD4Q9L8_9AGAM|nr:hypothetical protein EDB92DRAFT_2037898 [Lactarius akahatsu]